MKFKIVYFLITAFTGLWFPALAQHYSVQGKTETAPVYRLDKTVKHAVLQMGYASSVIQDPELWKNDNKRITEIDIVFTAYPRKKEAWITDYDWLLNKRIEAVRQLTRNGKGIEKIAWRFILQTACGSEEEAQRMFHGAVIKYTSDSSATCRNSIATGQQTSAALQEIYNQIEGITYGLEPFSDSVVFKTFDRNKWSGMLIVNDWTGSMYPYGAQAVLWHRMNFPKRAVNYFIFFNDGNNKPDKLKRPGNTGGIYYSKPDSIEYVLKVMKLVAKRGTGGDIPENNMEALLKGTRIFKGFDQLVMIADNNAGVRDMRLLPRLTVPVRIILCGLEKNQPIHAHYLELARKTHGSIHTIEEDITTLGDLKEGDKITLAGLEYVVKKGKITLSRKAHPVAGLSEQSSYNPCEDKEEKCYLD